MGWYKQGEYLIAESSLDSRLRTWIYNKGVHYVPIVFLGEDKPYGEITHEDRVKIEIDNFYRIASSLREGLRHSLDFKASLQETTWRELKNFAEITKNFEGDVFSNQLSPENFKFYMEAHARVCALVEFNTMIPISWIKAQLESIQQSEELIVIDNFTYCAVMPHRIMVRWAKLRLMLALRNNPTDTNVIHSFVRRYGYLEPSIDPVFNTPEKIHEIVENDIRVMNATMSTDEIKAEIRSIHKNRKDSKQRYTTNMQKVFTAMQLRGRSSEDILNFLSLLSTVSLASTEEEYRHILQCRFFRSLGIVVDSLNIPRRLASVDQITELLQCMPAITFKNDIKGGIN